MRKRYLLLPLLVAIGFVATYYSQAIQSDIYPVGSYQLSCENIVVESNSLTANCETINGAYKLTTLSNLPGCLNSITRDGDIGNIDGSLMCLPDLPKVDTAITFPEAEITINDWVYNKKTTNIYQHAWGMWAGLTSFVGVADDTQVRAFETWATINNILYQIENLPANTSLQEMKALPMVKQSMKMDLSLPSRLKNKKSAAITTPLEDGDTNIFVSVAYNPPAARHAISNKLLLQSTLNTFLKNGYTEIPNFPVNAITIKPVYKVISSENTVNGIYTFPGWPGTPTPAKPFPEKDWNNCVYVNITSTGSGGSTIDEGCNNRNASNTFYLDNFIHQKINQQNAEYLSEQLSITVSAGDYAILVGMHVTSRETKRWTWQSFWWSANPAAPHLPSSNAMASQRPTEFLDAGAQHYALTVAYNMVSPAQPITGGENVGASVIGYNPHLEAGFSPNDFHYSRKINGTIDNQYGVQTNCMTCHNLALYNPQTNYTENDGANRETPYGTDYYMSITDPVFDNTLKLDFAWSILGGLKLDEPQP